MKRDDEKTAREGALGLFKRRVGGSDAAAHFNLGVAYAEMGLLEEAVAQLEKVLELEPGHVEARAALLAARIRLGRPPADDGAA